MGQCHLLDWHCNEPLVRRLCLPRPGTKGRDHAQLLLQRREVASSPRGGSASIRRQWTPCGALDSESTGLLGCPRRHRPVEEERYTSLTRDALPEEFVPISVYTAESGISGTGAFAGSTLKARRKIG